MPYDFASFENLLKVQRGLPDEKYYNPTGMTEDEFKEWREFYDKNKDKKFDFKEDTIDYCLEDCRVLMYAVSQFRHIIYSQTGIDPIFAAPTTATLAKKIFLSESMINPDILKVGVVPARGYGVRKNANSREALIMLHYLEERDNITIRTALHADGEYIVPSIGPVDGYCEETNTVYEILGCYWHSCCDTTCKVGRSFQPKRKHPSIKKWTHGENLSRTYDKI